MKASRIIVILFIFISTVAFSQKRQIKKANAAFQTGEYFKATELYEIAYPKLQDKKMKAEISFKLGECYRTMNNYKKAKKWYNKAVRGKYNNPYATLYLADALKMNNEYTKAKGYYEKFSGLMPDDERGKYGVQSCDYATEWKTNQSRYVVSVVPTINSKLSDFSPSIGRSKSELFFTSTRQSANGKNPSKITGESYADIFMANKDRKGKWSVPEPVEGGVNTEGSEGASCVINDGGVMYFTSCKQEEGKNLGCKIYRARKTSDGWSEAQVVEIVGDSTINLGHPAVTKDELTIYFVSDSIPGKKSKGGKDIWKSTRSSSSAKWGKPVNLSKINTKGDEMFPYIRENGVLYFSSNAHPGLGGLDIFKAVPKGSSWEITNLRPPINSSKDDYGITFNGEKEEGYFSTKRAKNDKIYSFKLPALVFSVKGKVTNSKTDEPLMGATVTLKTDNGKKSEITSASDGSFRFRIEPNVDFTITAQREKFLTALRQESTRGLKTSKTFEMVIDLGPIGDGVFELPNIEYEVGKTELKPESMKSLDELVELLTVNSNLTIELSANTDFRGDDAFNQKLSEGRANSVMVYLVSKGIKSDRLTSIGNGEKKPKEIKDSKLDKKIINKYDFIKYKDVLSEDFINKLTTNEQKEICHQLNRRTEFRVLRDDYGVNKGHKFGH